MRIWDWSSDVCSSDLGTAAMALCQMEGAEPSPGIITTSGPEPCTVTEMRRDEKTDAASASPGIRLAIVNASAPASHHLRFCSIVSHIGASIHPRSDEHTPELPPLIRTSYAVFCL